MRVAGRIAGGIPAASPTPAPVDVRSANDGAGVTAIVGVRVFDGESAHENMTVLIEGEAIVGVGRDLALPAGATVVNGAGRTLLPGLIDAHVHVWEPAHLETGLVFGVTTMLDMMTPASAASAFRSAQEGDAGFTRADLLSAGYAATAPGGHGTEYGFPVPTLTRPDEAADFVAERVAEGSDYIKIIHDDGSLYGLRRQPTLDLPTMRAVVEAAHSHGRLAVVHPGALAGARAALDAGADALVDVWGDSVPAVAFIERMRASSMFVVPTLGVQSSVDGVAGGAALLDDARLLAQLAPDARVNLGRAFPRAPESRASYQAAARSVALLRLNDVPVLAGSDAPNPGTWYGVSLHDELLRLVRDADFTPAEALAAATSVPARAFGLRDRGTIEIGQRADLLLVEGDPTADITATRAIVSVWKRGRLLDRTAFARAVAQQVAATERAAQGVTIPEGGILLSDFEGGSAASAMGRWMVSTDQLAGGTSTGAMSVVDDAAGGHALHVSGVVNGGVQFAWSGVMLFPAAQPMQPIDLSAARGVSFRARGPGPFSVAIFTTRGGRVPAVRPFTATNAWQTFEFGWSDFGAHDGADVQGIAILAGPAPGAYELRLDDVRLVR